MNEKYLGVEELSEEAAKELEEIDLEWKKHEEEIEMRIEKLLILERVKYLSEIRDSLGDSIWK